MKRLGGAIHQSTHSGGDGSRGGERSGDGDRSGGEGVVCAGSFGLTSEVAGPLPEVHGHVEYKIVDDTEIQLSGYAFYGGGIPVPPGASETDATIIDMLISKQQIGLNQKCDKNVAVPLYQLTGGISTGTYTTVGNNKHVVTMSDYDLYNVKLSFVFPTLGLGSVNTFTYTISHALRPCNHPVPKAQITNVQQFGPAFTRNINIVDQVFSVATGPASTIYMSNGKIFIEDKVRGEKMNEMREIYTQAPVDAFWYALPSEYGTRPMWNNVLYDAIAERFVIVQIRWIDLADVFVYTASEILFAISTTANPTLADKDWCKFSFDRSTPTVIPIPPGQGITQALGPISLSSDVNAYYVGYNYFTAVQGSETDALKIVGIRKSEIVCGTPSLPTREVLNIVFPADDTTAVESTLLFPQMFPTCPLDYIYAIHHLDNRPLVVYRVSLDGVRKRTLPITLNQLGAGSAVYRNNRIWFAYEIATSSIIWYEINAKTLMILQNQIISDSSGIALRTPSLMIDRCLSMFLALGYVENGIWSSAYTFRKREDQVSTTRPISVIRRGSQALTVRGRNTLTPGTSINPSGKIIHSYGGYSERTGNWKSVVLEIKL